MIDTDKIDDLSRLYRLFILVPDGLPSLKRSLKASIAQRGKEINQSSLGTDDGEANVEDKSSNSTGKRPANSNAQTLQLALKWVQDVLALKDKFDHVWKQAFESDRDLESTLNEVRW